MSQGNTDVTNQVSRTGTAALCGTDHLQPCALGEVLDQISGKWAIGIIHAASGGPVRFTELERIVEGISRRMLTLNLRKLERDGLLIRTVHPTVPPRVEYELTEAARELNGTFALLVDWAMRHRGSIAASRQEYDAGRAKPAGQLPERNPRRDDASSAA